MAQIRGLYRHFYWDFVLDGYKDSLMQYLAYAKDYVEGGHLVGKDNLSFYDP